jgi:hypothetical protein
MLGVLGLQGGRHIVTQEGTYFINPRPLRSIQADIHEG